MRKTAIAAALAAMSLHAPPGGAGERRGAPLESASVSGEVMARADSERASQLHQVPVRVERIGDSIYQARGVGNVHVIATPSGHVLFDTGLATQAAEQRAALREALPAGDITHIILSHSHADHTGGVGLWRQRGTRIIAHHDFAEEQRYLGELEPYFWRRNRLLFPFMPERPQGGPLAYGGIVPDIVVRDWQVHEFEQGGARFEVYGTPAAEGADNVVLWLPDERILFSGDAFGPLFPQFPNVFTMRGEKIRKPVEYIRSLELMIALRPEMIVPSHFAPVRGLDNTLGGMRRMRDAVRHVHDAVVAGMNAGRSVHQLMREIALPEELYLSQGHGKVSWAVKSIWEYYATWFHFDSTTELYGVPARAVHAQLGELAGVEALLAAAAGRRELGQCVHALHLLEIALAGDPGHQGALRERRQCLEMLLEEARVLDNSYEVRWLESRIAATAARLAE